MSKKFKRTSVKSTRVSYNYRPDTSLREEEQSMYRRIYITLFVIIMIAVGLYFWGVEIVAALGGVWRYANPSSGTETPVNEDPSGAPLVAPRVDPLPLNTKEPKIDIRGWAQAGIEIKIFLNGQEIATLLSDKNGRFELTSVELAKGKNEIYAQAKSGSQVSGSSETQTIELDTEKPKLEVTLGQPTDEGKLEVKGTTDVGVNLFVNDSRAIVQTDGAFTYIQSLNNGKNILKIKAEDLAGNITEMERSVDYVKPSPAQ